MNIAIADDETILLVHLSNIVSQLMPGASIKEFSSTAKLIDEADKTKFDIAFLDINMPGLSGIELAHKLQQTNSRINIIFVTGYDGYQSQAMDLFASGYVKKPATKEKISLQLDNLRYPIEEETNINVYAQTFGNFTLFVNNKPVNFSRAKSQMAMAYLIHCRGAVVTKKELSGIIFEDGNYDGNRISYMSKICTDIKQTLHSFGVEDLVVFSSRGITVDCKKIKCDLYDFLEGKEEAKAKYLGEYMSQYSFGEELIPILNDSI